MPEQRDRGRLQDAPVRFLRPHLPDLKDVARHWKPAQDADWYSNSGPVLRNFSDALETYLGADVNVVPVSSATTALMLALRALCDPHRGSKVLMPSYTFAATATAALWAGLEPRFVDVDGSHWHADPACVEEAVRREKPAALLLCSTYGVAPPRAVAAAWTEIAHSAGIPLIVDSAAGFGARDENGERTGFTGDIEIFSFHATKPFAIGEGGIATTRDPRIADAVRRLANFGLDDDRVVRGKVGTNAKMDELHAALGLAVLEGFDDVLLRRRQYASRLAEAFCAADLAPQTGMTGASHQFLPMLCQTAEQRTALMALARRRGIELRTYFSEPLHAMPAFSAFREGARLHVTESLASRIICFPVYSEMSDALIDRISELAEDGIPT